MLGVSFGLVSTCILALILALSSSVFTTLGITLTYLLFYFRLYPAYRIRLKRVEATKHIPKLLEDLEQAHSAGKSVRDSFNAAIEALPHGVLGTELKFLRKKAGLEGYLGLTKLIPGREVKSLVAGISLLLAAGNPRPAQVKELKTGIKSICQSSQQRLGRFQIIATACKLVVFLSALFWIYLGFQMSFSVGMEVALLLQLVALVSVVFLSEQVAGA